MQCMTGLGRLWANTPSANLKPLGGVNSNLQLAFFCGEQGIQEQVC